ncbi:MAG: hypothetical protein K8I00_08210 [Candidatus Omnitrophica bacterium]|nr:hypothetical protein [Candidatus Omnitrophota bacterium]
MPEPINRKLEIFSTDLAKDVTSLSCSGCQIFVKFMDAPENARQSEKFLVTSLKIVPRGDITEYWLTFLEHQSEALSDDDIRNLIRKVHQRGLHKSCKKIISFIEYGDSDKPNSAGSDPDKDSPVTHRFNFII